MKRNYLLLAIPFSALSLSACGGVDVGRIFSDDTAIDAVGLPRSEPGAIVIDDGETTVPTPYGGSGANTSCSEFARDIARLTALLGPDEEPAETDSDAYDDRSTTDRARVFASDAVSRAPGAAEGLARSAIVGLNPVRPVVRFLGGAGEIEAAARREREIALKRRAWLRGAYDIQRCHPRILNEALGAYNLLAAPEEG